MIDLPQTLPCSAEPMVTDLYRCMLRIRRVEERIRDEYAHRNIRCAVHLSLGQEAAAAGVLLACQPTDCCVSTHRCHAHYLAKGGDLQAMVDELYGLPSGCCRGYGGSMHLFDRRVNMWGSSAILGGSVPIGTGLALALKRSRSEAVSVVFGGDGGIDEGVFYESLNLAALLRLPVLFVVENNGYSTLTPQQDRQANPDVVAKARAFGLQALTIDGNDAAGVFTAAHQAIGRVRREGRPELLELVTYRLCAHVGPASDLGLGERPREEFELASEREPILRFRSETAAQRPELLQRFVEIEAAVEHEVDEVFERAKRCFADRAAACNLPPPPPPLRHSGV